MTDPKKIQAQFQSQLRITYSETPDQPKGSAWQFYRHLQLQRVTSGRPERSKDRSVVGLVKHIFMIYYHAGNNRKADEHNAKRI